MLTSSSSGDAFREDGKWQHGAFTKVLLAALADPDRTGLITPLGLANYVISRVDSLTGGQQKPEVKICFSTTLFAGAQ